MKKLLQLKERISSIVYHGTYIHRLYDILKTNEFHLTSNLGTSSDQIGGDYFYYLSVARIKFGGYMRSFSLANACILVLDGDKFNNRYKGGPVDYWGREFRSASDSLEGKLRNDENEERIFSDNDTIPKAMSYIKEIHISMSDFKADNEDDFFEIVVEHDDYQTVKNIARLALSEGIPVYIYANPSAFQSLDTRKAKTEIVKPDLVLALVQIYNNFTMKDLKNYAAYEYSLKNLAKYMNYYLAGDPAWGFDKDTIASLKADIHNARSNSDERQNIAKLTNIMKKEKVRTIEDLLVAVANKVKSRGETL